MRWRPEVKSLWGRRGGRTRSAWRVATPVALGVSGVLVVTSAANSDGTDLRPGRYNDLGSVVRSENREVQRLQDRAGELSSEIEELGRQQGDETASAVRLGALGTRGLAGMEEQTGQGLTVTLSDAPREVFEASEQDPRRLVVHQQDIQAAVNALWRGGAEAVTLQGRRIVTTTGIKCAGSTVQIQGVVYPQPYVIGAVGDPVAMEASLDGDDALDAFREDAAEPDIDIGYDVAYSPDMTAPAYDGLLDVTYAQPMG